VGAFLSQQCEGRAPCSARVVGLVLGAVRRTSEVSRNSQVRTEGCGVIRERHAALVELALREDLARCEDFECDGGTFTRTSRVLANTTGVIDPLGESGSDPG
jgi:hypothetical protein